MKITKQITIQTEHCPLSPFSFPQKQNQKSCLPKPKRKNRPFQEMTCWSNEWELPDDTHWKSGWPRIFYVEMPTTTVDLSVRLGELFSLRPSAMCYSQVRDRLCFANATFAGRAGYKLALLRPHGGCLAITSIPTFCLPAAKWRWWRPQNVLLRSENLNIAIHPFACGFLLTKQAGNVNIPESDDMYYYRNNTFFWIWTQSYLQNAFKSLH